MSPQAEEVLATKADNLIGRDCHEVFSPRFCGENCSFCETGRLASREKKTYKTTFTNGDGVKKDLEMNVIPLIGEHGKPIGLRQDAVAYLNNVNNARVRDNRVIDPGPNLNRAAMIQAINVTGDYSDGFSIAERAATISRSR